MCIRDRVVGVYVNAFAALRDVSGQRLPPDRLEGNARRGAATELQFAGGAASLDTLAISSASDRDWFHFTLDDFASIDGDINFVPALGPLNVGLLADDLQ